MLRAFYVTQDPIFLKKNKNKNILDPPTNLQEQRVQDYIEQDQ